MFLELSYNTCEFLSIVTLLIIQQSDRANKNFVIIELSFGQNKHGYTERTTIEKYSYLVTILTFLMNKCLRYCRIARKVPMHVPMIQPMVQPNTIGMG
jgi:hypothetical protein